MSLLNLLEEFIMFEKIRKMKNKKGFTLVELIVVLVILAILAAMLIPALTGYIDKAREQSLITEGSLVLTAAQATVSEAYGTGDLKVGTDGAITVTNKAALASQINQLAELKTGASWKFDVVLGSETNYKSIKIQNLIYSDGKNSIDTMLPAIGVLPRRAWRLKMRSPSSRRFWIALVNKVI